MLTPLSVAGSLVVNSSQEVELLERNLLLLNAQLVVELALSGPLDTINGILEA